MPGWTGHMLCSSADTGASLSHQGLRVTWRNPTSRHPGHPSADPLKLTLPRNAAPNGQRQTGRPIPVIRSHHHIPVAYMPRRSSDPATQGTFDADLEHPMPGNEYDDVAQPRRKPESERKIGSSGGSGSHEVRVAGRPAPVVTFLCLRCVSQPATPILLIESG